MISCLINGKAFLMRSHRRAAYSHFLSNEFELGNVLTVMFDVALATIVVPVFSEPDWFLEKREKKNEKKRYLRDLLIVLL